MDNILEILKKYVTTDVVKHLMNTLGESETGISRSIDTAMPTVFAGLLNCTNDHKVMGGIHELLQETHNTGNALANISSYVGDNEGNPFLALGGKLLGTLFGGRIGSVSEYISSHAGVKKASATAVLGMVTPMIMGFLGREIKDERLNIGGLIQVLKGQKANILSGISAGALSSLELNHINSQKGMAAAMDEDMTKGTGLNWLLPLAAMIILGGFLLYNVRGCNSSDANTPNSAIASTPSQPATPPTPPAIKDTTAKVDTAAQINPMWAHLGKLSSRKLANGNTLYFPEKGVENRILSFIEDKAKQVDKTTWFDFDRLLFDTGKATLRKESQEQLQNVSEILKAYPNVAIKIGGYTDNQGKEENNMKLSGERANTAMGEIIKMGIDGSRIEAEGYGSQHPVADNATPEGREKNRRVSIRVTKK